ncbi:MAG: AAA family ATPase [Methanoregulaceae archaeon]|nr:AAA family ATPase [Methanoregulaceae archaeon]
MLEKVITIQGVGLFEEASTPVDFGRVTLIYGENAKGKSTFAWILSNAAKGDATQMAAKKTFKFGGSPKVGLLFSTKGGKLNCTFKDGAWSNTFASIEVFDSVFVDDNVYSGMAVESKQRQQLLDFVLGDVPVEIKKSIDRLDSDSRRASADKSSAEATLRGYAAPYTVPQYIKATVPADLEIQLQRALQTLQDVKNAESIHARVRPKSIMQLGFFLDELFAQFQVNVKGLEESAERRLRQHIGTRPANMEPWLQEGLEFCIDDRCPFCGQAQAPDSLIDSYKAFFNEAYREFQQNLGKLVAQARTRMSDATVEKLITLATTNNDAMASWAPQVDLKPVPFPEDTFRAALTTFRESLEGLVAKKLSSPLEAISEDAQAEVTELAEQVNTTLDDYRTEVNRRIEGITQFLQSLKKGSVKQVETDVSKLEALKKRSLPVVADLVGKYTTAAADYKRLNEEKGKLQRKLRELAPSIITPYVTEINKLLKSFGAEFVIESVAQANDGGRPTVKYSLNVRGNEVQLGNRESSKGSPSFGSSLSEGDKRTLALAFFLAKIRTDTSLPEKVIVIDDPMSSLDRNRQRQTIQVLEELSRSTRQLVVLSHDARFLEALRAKVIGRAAGGVQPGVVALALTRGQVGVSFSVCNLNRLAMQGYADKRARLQEYLDGKNGDPQAAIPLVRAVLEGFLKLKYPTAINPDHSLGDIIYQKDTYPVFVKQGLEPHLERLKVLNGTCVFSHGGNLDDELGVTDSEVRQWAQEVLDLIHGGL